MIEDKILNLIQACGDELKFDLGNATCAKYLTRPNYIVKEEEEFKELIRLIPSYIIFDIHNVSFKIDRQHDILTIDIPYTEKTIKCVKDIIDSLNKISLEFHSSSVLEKFKDIISSSKNIKEISFRCPSGTIKLFRNNFIREYRFDCPKENSLIGDDITKINILSYRYLSEISKQKTWILIVR